jgi:hypothetical protein
MYFIETMLQEFADATATPPAQPQMITIASPCEYQMSPAVKQKIEDMSRRDIKRVIQIYQKLLNLTGPQTLMVRMLLLKEPLENLDKQNINLVSMFMQNLAKNLQPEAEDASP